MVRFVDTFFYLLEYSELFFLFMFQFNWITTPLGRGGREVLYQMFAWLIFSCFIFCCCKLC